jgi:hypothetical protein
MLEPLQFPRTDGSPDPILRHLAAAVNEWLATHPQPLIELPRPARTTQQWLTWMRAEGFITDVLEAPYGPTPWCEER